MWLRRDSPSFSRNGKGGMSTKGAYQLPMREALLLKLPFSLPSYLGSVFTAASARNHMQNVLKTTKVNSKRVLLSVFLSHFFCSCMVKEKGQPVRRQTCNPEDTSSASLKIVTTTFALLKVVGQSVTRYTATIFVTNDKIIVCYLKIEKCSKILFLKISRFTDYYIRIIAGMTYYKEQFLKQLMPVMSNMRL